MKAIDTLARFWREIQRSFCIMQRSRWSAPWRDRTTGC